MIIQYASDLHLEFRQNREFLKAHPLQPKGEVLLLAGDIVPFSVMGKHKDFFNYVSDHFETTYWIPGNHEYYHFDLAEKCGTIHEHVKSNLHLVNNMTVALNNIRFIFSTLWSKINPGRQWYIERSVSDFHAIKYGGRRFSVDRFNELHAECLDFITSAQGQCNTGKTIVVTHHVPTFFNYPVQYKNSDLSEAFGVELYDLIETMQPDYWIYGHHHSNVPDFIIGKTQLLTNQVGYVQNGEHELFDPGKFMTVERY